MNEYLQVSGGTRAERAQDIYLLDGSSGLDAKWPVSVNVVIHSNIDTNTTVDHVFVILRKLVMYT